MLNERNTLLEDDGIEEEILVEEECSVAQAVWGDIQGNIENQTDLQNALDAKQDSLTESQLSAVNSGITSEKVTTYDGYADQIASKADQSALNAESVARGEADTALGTRIDNEALARQSADNGLQTQIDAITSKSDVVDVVANYAALQAYDTSTLGNNDVVKVLDDETHEDALTYYRWSTTTQTWSYIGQEAPYYSKGQMDVKLAEKQDKLTAGANIQIQNGTISATDTTYTAGNGLNLNGTEFSADTDVLATKEDLEGYYTKPETDNLLAPKLEAEVVTELPTTGAEGKLYLTPKAHTTSTATGNPIEATITAQAGQLESFQLDGDTFQQSYTGKNLYNVEAIPYVSRRAYASDGAVVNWTNYTGTDEYQPVEPNTEYTIWNNKARDTTYLCEYDENKNFIRRTIEATTFTTTATTKYLRWSIYVGAGEIPPTQTQLELGATASSFEPYVGGQPSPSPEFPQQIQTVTGEQTVTVTGKNLLNAVPYATPIQQGVKVTITNTNTIHIDGTSTQTYVNLTRIFSTNLPAGTYTMSINKELPFRVSLSTILSGGGSLDRSIQAGETSVTFTTSETTTGMRIFMATGGAGIVFDETFTVQLVSGNAADYDFEPYSSANYPISLGSLELCKLVGFGSSIYRDTIYKNLTDSKWYLHKEVGKYTFNGSEEWAQSSRTTTDMYVGALNIVSLGITANESRNKSLANRAIIATTSVVGSFSIFNVSSGVSQYMCYAVSSSYAASLAQFKEKLATDNLIVYAPLVTPTDTTITDTNLIAQLEAIRNASLATGANTITNTATGTNLAGDMEIGYFGFNPTNRYDKFIWLNLNNNYEQIGGE